MKSNQPFRISIHELKLLAGSQFRLDRLKEYFEEGGVYWKNDWQPTHYMMLKGEPKREPKAVLDLLFHIVDYDVKRYAYFLNWIAFFFRYLKHSQVAIALIGNQGAGKGVLFDTILCELFGREYCVSINDESLNTKYKAKLIRGKLFYNFDEITYATSKRNDSVLKAIITNPTITLEEKNVTIDKEIKLHGQCLFTSNHTHALRIEASDRRFTVFNTNDDISKNSFLNFGSYAALEAAIKRDLEDFARYLKNYDVDIELANKALDTPEKSIIINASQDNLNDFHRAIINMDMKYFSELQETNLPLYITINSNFQKGKIDRIDITKSYNTLFSGKSMTSKEIMAKLREFKPHNIFTDENMSHSGSMHYYHLIGRK